MVRKGEESNMNKDKPEYWSLIKKNGKIAFRSVFDFMKEPKIDSFLCECQEKRCSVLFCEENILFDFTRNRGVEKFKQTVKIVLLQYVISSLPQIMKEYSTYIDKYLTDDLSPAFSPLPVENAEPSDKVSFLSDEVTVM